MRTALNLSVVATLLLPLGAGAQSMVNVNFLPAACEEALALSALPKRLRDNASAYVLTPSGYELTRKRNGPFTCIVARNHEDALIPQCPDAAGAESIVPGIMLKSKWSLDGVAAQERETRFRKAAADGGLEPPSRPGISYMMSNFNYVWNAQAGSLIRVPPHVMFYAPGLTNDDIGGSFEEGTQKNRGVPFIIEEGIHGYMISFVEHASDSKDVLAACDDHLPAVATTLGGRRPGGEETTHEHP